MKLIKVSEIKSSKEKILVYAKNTTKQSKVIFGLIVRPGETTRTPLLRSSEEWVKQSLDGFKFWKAEEDNVKYNVVNKEDTVEKKREEKLPDGSKVNIVDGSKDGDTSDVDSIIEGEDSSEEEPVDKESSSDGDKGKKEDSKKDKGKGKGKGK